MPYHFAETIESFIYIYVLILLILEFECNKAFIVKEKHICSTIYRTRAIITCGLYIFNPLFEGQKRFFKEVFSENSALMYGYYSRAVCIQERVMMARVR